MTKQTATDLGLTITGLVMDKNVYPGDPDRYSLDIAATGIRGPLTVSVEKSVYDSVTLMERVSLPLNMREWNNRTYFSHRT